ncbi:Detected protein of confused Function [Hibiscus syriacus]|uniref:Detected protein of confused Function n=1 Tax=Hibiscus syriacus TaxID=106335 RepID=A0A6A3AH24_HIBSY|nr:Detected protein of confused Function [Hibiscus syriacus]
MSVNISLAPDFKLPGCFCTSLSCLCAVSWDVVTGMLAKGFILGKDAVNKAKSFDEKHQITSTASAKVVSFNKKIGFTEKVSAGATVVGDKERDVDQKFQVSGKIKSALAEQKVSSASSAIMKNRYVFTGASWVTGVFNKVAKAAGDFGHITKEKVGAAEEERKRKVADDFAQIHLSDESPNAPAQGLIL